MKKNTQVAAGAPYYDTFFVLNDKGGTRKSTFLIFLWALLVLEGRKPLGYEIDQQRRIGRLYGEAMHTLVLPEVERFTTSETADTAILTPLMAALEETNTERPLLVEIGANLSDRVATVLGADPLLAETVTQSDRKIALLLMMDGQEDTINAGCHAARLLKHVLPMADIIVVQREQSLSVGPRFNQLSESARERYGEIIAPAAREGRIFVWPDMSHDVRRAFEAAGKTPLEFRKLNATEVGRLTHPDDADNLAQLYIGRRTLVAFNLYLGRMMEEAAILGFRSSSDA